jgi:hypothetical protein
MELRWNREGSEVDRTKMHHRAVSWLARWGRVEDREVD